MKTFSYHHGPQGAIAFALDAPLPEDAAADVPQQQAVSLAVGLAGHLPLETWACFVAEVAALWARELEYGRGWPYPRPAARGTWTRLVVSVARLWADEQQGKGEGAR